MARTKALLGGAGPDSGTPSCLGIQTVTLPLPSPQPHLGTIRLLAVNLIRHDLASESHS